MKLELIDNNSDKLIVFLTGWGCDFRQFQLLKSYGFDILIGYDYSDLDFNFDFSKYKEVNLITFSAGVYVAGLIQNKLPKLKRKVAINGNPYAHDSYYGLSEEIKNQFKSVSKDKVFEFRRKYLVFTDKELELLNKYQPHRSLESCLNELFALNCYYTNDYIPLKFDLAVLSVQDMIFNINRQIEYYEKNSTPIKKIENAGHFLFFKYKSFNELLFE